MTQTHITQCRECGCDVFVRIENEGVAIVHPLGRESCKSRGRYFATRFAQDTIDWNLVDRAIRAWNEVRSLEDCDKLTSTMNENTCNTTQETQP